MKSNAIRYCYFTHVVFFYRSFLRRLLFIAFLSATGQLGTRPTRHLWRVDLLILHTVWRVDHTDVTSWLLVGRVVGYSQLQIKLTE